MQREIKFRAWNPDTEEMKIIDSYYWEEFGSCDEDFSKCMPQEEILLQYIGIEDEKGIKIYEGDIVNWQYFDAEINEQIGYGCGYIKYLAPQWVILENHGTIIPICIEDKEFEITYLQVIGNIYQNPKLLNE